MTQQGDTTKLTYDIETRPRYVYLGDILGRLRNEVGPYFAKIEDINSTGGRKVGFWGGVRLLMPVVEATAEAVGEKSWELLGRHLDVETPSLVWQQFRHALTHDDEVRVARWNGHNVGWAISLNRQPHQFRSGLIQLDLLTLYDKLCQFLEDEVAKGDETQLAVRIGVVYQNPKAYILDDFRKLE